MLNAVSTTAWVRAGKVYGNRMIDLGISNSKLFYRAQGPCRRRHSIHLTKYAPAIVNDILTQAHCPVRCDIEDGSIVLLFVVIFG